LLPITISLPLEEKPSFFAFCPLPESLKNNWNYNMLAFFCLALFLRNHPEKGISSWENTISLVLNAKEVTCMSSSRERVLIRAMNPLAQVKLYCARNGGVPWNLVNSFNGNWENYNCFVLTVKSTKNKCKVKVEPHGLNPVVPPHAS
jgi:hypothetical protein